MIEERVLAYVGPPHIFHSDNGREFVNQLLHSLLETWSSGNVTFVNGRPRHFLLILENSWLRIYLKGLFLNFQKYWQNTFHMS